MEREGGDTRFFGPDSLWNYELGAKGTSAGGTFSYSAAAFVIKWDDMQTSRSFDCGFGFRENVGAATSQGVELEMSWLISEAWNASFTTSYANATVDKWETNFCDEDDHTEDPLQLYCPLSDGSRLNDDPKGHPMPNWATALHWELQS